MKEDFERWVYHETKSPKIIKDSEFEQVQAEGWADSPAKFLKLESIGISQAKIIGGDEEEAAKAQQAFDAVEGVKESINGALNLKRMNKKQLEEHAKEHYGVDLDRRLTPNKMIKQIEALMES